MERNIGIKHFLLQNGTELTLWAKDGELCGIAYKDRKPIFPYILGKNEIRKLVKGNENKPSLPSETQLPIGFVMSSNQFKKTVPPEIELGKFIAGGTNGRVFECTSPKGYVIKVVHLVPAPFIKEPRPAFLKEVHLACEMSILGIGPAVECFWIADGVKNLEGSRFRFNPNTNYQMGPVNEKDGDSFGFILSKRMDMTYDHFLQEYPESYFKQSEMNQDLDMETEATRNKNRETVQEFIDRLKKVCYERQVFIADLHFANIMVNVEPRNPQQGQLITDMRVVDFGFVHELMFDIDSIQCIGKIVRDIRDTRKKRYKSLKDVEKDAKDPRADAVISKLGELKYRERDFIITTRDILRGKVELEDDDEI